MRRGIRRTATAAVLAIAALCLAAAGAGALPRIVVPSHVTIESDSLDFSGEVRTPKYEPCEQERKVVLFKVVQGGPDEAVGRDTTNAHGEWAITPQGSAGISLARFYAKVRKVSQGTAGPIYVCKAARSKTIKPSN